MGRLSRLAARGWQRGRGQVRARGLIGSNEHGITHEPRRIAADARLGTAQVGTAQAIATKKARNEASPEALEAELSELKRRQGERERQLSGLVKEYDDTCRKAYEARADMAHARVLYYSAHLEDALSELAAVYRMAGERGRLICDTTEPDEDAFGRYMETLSVQLADLRIKP